MIDLLNQALEKGLGDPIAIAQQINGGKGFTINKKYVKNIEKIDSAIYKTYNKFSQLAFNVPYTVTKIQKTSTGNTFAIQTDHQPFYKCNKPMKHIIKMYMDANIEMIPEFTITVIDKNTIKYTWLQGNELICKM